jgi:hypothetical protein
MSVGVSNCILFACICCQIFHGGAAGPPTETIASIIENGVACDIIDAFFLGFHHGASPLTAMGVCATGGRPHRYKLGSDHRARIIIEKIVLILQRPQISEAIAPIGVVATPIVEHRTSCIHVTQSFSFLQSAIPGLVAMHLLSAIGNTWALHVSGLLTFLPLFSASHPVLVFRPMQRKRLDVRPTIAVRPTVAIEVVKGIAMGPTVAVSNSFFQ